MNESQKKAKAKYKEKIVTLRVELYPTDKDIKDHLAEKVAAGETKSGYIKRLIRADIKQLNWGE